MSELKKPSAWGSREIIVTVSLIFIFGLLGMIVVSNFVHPCCASSANSCASNLRQIDGAAAQFALENHLTNGDRINFPDDLTPYIKLNKTGKIPSCPDGGLYHLSRVGENPTCSLGNHRHACPRVTMKCNGFIWKTLPSEGCGLKPKKKPASSCPISPFPYNSLGRSWHNSITGCAVLYALP